jgi:hypothetical protein
VLNEGEEEQQPVRKKGKKDFYCASCKKLGHATTRSKACANHVPKGTKTPTITALPGPVAACDYILTDADQVEDVANFKTFGLEDESDEDDNGAALLGVAAMQTNDERMNDLDGDNIYNPPTGPN